MEEIRETIDSLCDKAVKYAKGFSKNLDFSEDSIKDVEEIIDYYRKDLRGIFSRILSERLKRKNQQIIRYGQWLLFGVLTLAKSSAGRIQASACGYMRMNSGIGHLCI